MENWTRTVAFDVVVSLQTWKHFIGKDDSYIRNLALLLKYYVQTVYSKRRIYDWLGFVPFYTLKKAQ